MALAGGMALASLVIPMIPNAISMLNSVIASLRALGMSDTDILAHIAQSEAKIDPLILKVSGFVVQRHPDDKEL